MATIPGLNKDAMSLWQPFRVKIELLLARLTNRGFDPVIFEAKRSEARQRYLYSIGRTRDKNKRPVTWTMHSRHLVGKAVDIISKKHGWSSAAFYDAMEEEVRKIDEIKSIPQEQCHVEWQG
jgi:hypothetical protein